MLDLIEKYGNMNKSDLVKLLYDESGFSHTKAELRSLSFGELLAMAIDGIYDGGSNCD